MITQDCSLKDRVVIVTGSRRGIGKGIALAFAEAGADVAVCDVTVNDGELDAVTKEVEKMGRRSLAVETDVTKKSDVDSLVRKVMDRFGRIDVLVNNAAIILRLKLIELEEKDWDKMINIDLKGNFLCSQAVAKIMVDNKTSGNIINIASSMGIRAGINRGAYSIAKAGVIMLTKVMAAELANYNIRVNAIAPHFIKTELNQSIWSNTEALDKLLADIPLGYPGEPKDVANAAVFLASDASRYVTGHTLAIDGGWLA